MSACNSGARAPFRIPATSTRGQSATVTVPALAAPSETSPAQRVSPTTGSADAIAHEITTTPVVEQGLAAAPGAATLTSAPVELTRPTATRQTTRQATSTSSPTATRAASKTPRSTATTAAHGGCEAGCATSTTMPTEPVHAIEPTVPAPAATQAPQPTAIAVQPTTAPGGGYPGPDPVGATPTPAPPPTEVPPTQAPPGNGYPGPGGGGGGYPAP